MSVLCDNTIYKLRHILFPEQDLDREQFQPCSVDLRLDKELKTVDGKTINIEDEPYTLKADEFILGSTIEKVRIPHDMLGRVEGRSSIGRLGVMVHITAGFIDAGFYGNLTLELYNCSQKPFTLRYDDRLCQIVFEKLDMNCTNPYRGKYQGDTGVVCSRWEDEG